MKKILTLVMVSVFAVSCMDSGNGPSSVSLNSEDDKTLYAMGYMLGGNLKRLELNDKEMSALYKGIHNAAKGTKSELDMGIYQPKIQTFFKARMEVGSKKIKEGGQKSIKDYVAKHKDAKTTKSGLVYRMIKEGTGKMPVATDKVEVHYHGTLTNGEVFDSSVDRGKKISFPLNRVIKGWTEGLQLVKEGGKIELVIPSDLAYGDQGAPPKIPGGATLIFQVELFKINPEPAAPAAPAKVKK